MITSHAIHKSLCGNIHLNNSNFKGSNTNVDISDVQMDASTEVLVAAHEHGGVEIDASTEGPVAAYEHTF